MSVSAHRGAPWIEIADRDWWLPALWGILSVILGLWLFMQPVVSSIVLLSMTAVFWIVGGCADIVYALLRRTDSWGWRLAAGIIGVLAGLLVLGHPLYGAVVAVTFLYVAIGVSALISGLLGIVLQHHSLSRVILSLLQIAIGLLFLLNPLDVLTLIAVVQGLGIVTIIGGAATALAAFLSRTHRHAGVAI
jgi:uncharacterized membrane protein HdeD (DUF308 family)